jgi:hypothetical protein
MFAQVGLLVAAGLPWQLFLRAHSAVTVRLPLAQYCCAPALALSTSSPSYLLSTPFVSPPYLGAGTDMNLLLAVVAAVSVGLLLVTVQYLRETISRPCLGSLSGLAIERLISPSRH